MTNVSNTIGIRKSFKVIGRASAFDERGKRYSYEVLLTQEKTSAKSKGTVCMKFGRFGPLVYNLADLRKSFPLGKDFCIDAGGRNHGADNLVVIRKDTMNRLIERAIGVARGLESGRMKWSHFPKSASVVLAFHLDGINEARSKRPRI